MGLFSTRTRTKLPWKLLDSAEKLEEAFNSDKPILLFKHSTRCSISIMTLNSFESGWSSNENLCDLYFLDLLKHRDLSNEIERRTGVSHQSPQVILMDGKEILYAASHSSIDARRIQKILSER